MGRVRRAPYDILGNLLRVDQKGSAPADSSKWRTRLFTYNSLSQLLTANNPESGIITYSYDNDGELLQKFSPAPNQTGTATQTVSYCYDGLHRVTSKTYGTLNPCAPFGFVGPADFSYGYDSGTNGIGHLTGLADKAGTGSYGYEVMGRLATETRTLIGANNATISKNISYVYNLDGSVNTLTYPSGKVITYTPWHNGALGVSAPQEAKDLGSGINYVTSATYGPDGSLAGFISGSGGAAAITNLFSYNTRLQPCRMTASTGTLPVSCADADPTHRGNVYDITYDFHVGNGTSGTDNGNVWGITNNKDATRNQAFTYDPLNRLTSAQNAGTNCAATTVNGKTEYWGNSYGYDAWGNLLSKTVTKCGAENLSVTADAHNWIHSAAPDYQYDAAGNMTYAATAHLNYTFDQENRLTGAAGYTYTYDADGNRVRKSNGNLAANGTLYWYMTPGVVAESDLAGTLKSEYIFFDGERAARRDGATGTGGVFYYFSDHLKTASVITDSAGVIKAESDYYPWGSELQFVNNDTNDYKFTGKKRDIETGLDYFGARYYSNGLGRFISSDWSAIPVPVPYADLTDPQSLNLYGYVRGLPTTKADLDGHGFWRKLWNSGANDGCWCEDNELKKHQAEAQKKREEEAREYLEMRRRIMQEKGWDVIGAMNIMALSYADVYGMNATALQGGSKNGLNLPSEPTEEAPVEVTISRSKSPAAAQHIDDAQTAGQPKVLTLDRSGTQGAARAAARGRAATSGMPTAPGMDRDEYPPKCCAEGGAGASRKLIPSSDNRSGGGQMGQQTKNLPDGTKIIIKTGP